jgi:ribosome-binding factor A
VTHHRRERVESLLQQEIATIISRKVADPRVEGANIVAVSISADFHLARVYYSCIYDHRDLDALQKGLDHAKAFIRNELKKVIKLRILPELAFFYDPSIKRGDDVLDLLRSLAPKDE